MLDSVGKLGKILVGMNRALGEIPVTVKLRTGVKDGKNTAHKLMPRLSTEWNAGCITVRLSCCLSQLLDLANSISPNSSMDGPDNSGTLGFQIGTTSSNA